MSLLCLGLSVPVQWLKRAFPNFFLQQQTFSGAGSENQRKPHDSFLTMIVKSKEIFLRQKTRYWTIQILNLCRHEEKLWDTATILSSIMGI